MSTPLSIDIIGRDLASPAILRAGASMDALGRKMTAAQARASKFMAGVSKASVAVAAVVSVESVKMAADFQKQITLLETAGGESAGNLKAIAAGIMQIAQATGTSTSKLADGMYTVEKAGIRGADGLLVLKAAAEGAKAENVDLSIAAQALTSVMMSYHLSAQDAVSVENQLVAGAGAAKTNMQDYASSLATVIPVASAAGVSFAQVAAAIATLTQHGTSAEEATQELANTIRNLQAPSSVAIAAMQQLGLNVNDIETNLGSRGLTGTIDLITNAISSKLGPSGLVAVDAFRQSQSASADLQAMLAKMPPQLAAVSTAFLAGTLSMKDYRADFRGMGAQGYALGTQFLSLSSKADGFNQLLRAGNPAAATFAAYLKQVMGGATGMNTALQLGGENMTYFTRVAGEVGAAAKKTGSDISTWATTQATLAVQLDKARAAGQVLMIQIGSKLIPVVTAITSALVKHKQATLDVILAFATLAAVVTAARIAMVATNVVVAVSTGVMTGYRIATGAATTVTAAQTAIVKRSALAWLAQKTVMVATTLATKLFTAAQWLLNVAMDANPVVLVAMAIVALGVAFYEAYQHSQTFRNIISDIGDVFGLLKRHLDIVGASLIILGGPIAMVAGAAILIIHNWSAIVDFFTALPGRIVAAIESLPRLLGTAAKMAGEAMLQAFEWEIAAFIVFAVLVPVRIVRAMISLVTDLPHLATVAWAAFLSATTTAVVTILAFALALPGRIIGALASLTALLAATAVAAWGAFWSTTTSAFVSIVVFVAGLPSRIVGALAPLPGKLGNSASSAWGSFLAATYNAIVDVVARVTMLPGAILDAIGDMSNLLYNVGASIVDGLWRGFRDFFGGILSKMHDLLSKIPGMKGSPSFLDIAPVVLRPVGEQMMVGLLAGVEAKAPKAVSRMHAIVGGIAAQLALSPTPIGFTAPAGLTAPLPAPAPATAVSANGGTTVQTRLVMQGPFYGDEALKSGVRQILAEHDAQMTRALGAR